MEPNVTAVVHETVIVLRKALKADTVVVEVTVAETIFPARFDTAVAVEQVIEVIVLLALLITAVELVHATANVCVIALTVATVPVQVTATILPVCLSIDTEVVQVAFIA